MKHSLLLGAALTLSASAIAKPVTAPFDVNQLNTLSKLHSTVVLPGGDAVVYGVKKKTDKGYRSDLYLQKLGGEARQLTNHKSTEHNLVASKDGKTLYFLSGRSGSSQIWALPLDGGEAIQVSDLPLGIDGFKLSNDNGQVVMQLRVNVDCDTLQCSADKQKAKKENKQKGRHYDQLMVRHWDTWNDGLRNHLFVAKLEGHTLSKPVDVTAGLDTEVPSLPFSGMEEVAFTPDGKHVVYSAKAPSRDQAWQTNYDLWQVPVTGGDAVNLTADNLAWDSHPVFSDDGRYMAYAAMKRPGFEAGRFAVMLKDLQSGETREVAPLWDRSARGIAFAEESHTLYVSAQDLGQVAIYAMDVRFGDKRTLVAEGSNAMVKVTNGKLFYTHNDLSGPNDLYVMGLDGSGKQRLTDLNKDLLNKQGLGEFQQFSFKGWNNETVYGYWIKPAGFEQGKQYPVAFLVHGGPQGSFGNRWHGRWNAQLWAAAGFGVVMIDFHGSTGYGQGFTDSISLDWGGKPLVDLQKGLAAVGQQQPWLDTNNACAAGGSYGGYMMNWIAGNWSDGFKCLVNHAGLFDMRSFYNVTEELWFPEHEFGGSYWEATETYEKFNPVNHIDKWQTPMLVVHGAKDYRVPLEQGLAAFTVLQRKGIDSELLVFDEENHWIINPDNLVQWYDVVLGWMKRHTGQEQAVDINEALRQEMLSSQAE
ncbi:S9 family peptidase [Ferrimonas futtsuensis]|uniref:S9 family peptidase n=1 Tax=Ferrimonas futtsuensis TaxID=364764 RepID=UPI0004271D83|nr:S9 family peptidase [Ferrimonas futtsuensis]